MVFNLFQYILIIAWMAFLRANLKFFGLECKRVLLNYCKKLTRCGRKPVLTNIQSGHSSTPNDTFIGSRFL